MDKTLAQALLAKAMEKFGGERGVAERLRVPTDVLLTYRNGLAQMPEALALRLIDMVSDSAPATPPAVASPKESRRP